MQTETLNAGEEVDRLARKYEDAQGLCYSDALRKVAHEKPDLWARYSRGESAPDPKEKEGAEEFSRRITAYSEHFEISRDEAERRTRAHDPKMGKFYTRGGEVMSKKIVPLSPESVVDARVKEKMQGGGKSYAETMREVLAADERLAFCYEKNLPFIEADAARSYEADMPNVTAKSQLGVLVNGARNADNSIDIPLALSVCALVPDLVRRASGERLVEVANALIDRLGLRGQRSERFPEVLRQAERENPSLVAAQNTGRLDEQGFRDIFWTWFSRDRD